MVKLNAHFDGKSIVFDEPISLPLPSGTRLRVSVEAVEEPKAPPTAPAPTFQPLNLKIDPELARAIAEDPEFNIEES
jgi:hypothetical protein